jgi:hypothetical protein
MTYSRWHVYIGQIQTPTITPDADLYRSDGQKRSVYIYRFLTAGTIDGEFLSAFCDNTLLLTCRPQRKSTSVKSQS